VSSTGAITRSVASEPCDRRALLRGALRAVAGVGLAGGIPAVLAGCADVYHIPFPPPPIDYLISVAPLAPGVADMIAARAAKLGLAAPAGIQVTFGGIGEKPTVAGRYGDFVGETSPSYDAGGFSAFTDRLPRATNLAVVQCDASAAPFVHTVIGQQVQVVTYLSPLRYQTAQITVDSASLARLLATDAAAWAQTRPNGTATAVFVNPPAGPPAGSPAYDGPRPVSATAAEQAIRTVFADRLPDLTLTAMPDLDDPVGAVKADPSLRIVICADAVQAFTLARTLRQQLAPARRKGLYVGGLGNPSIYAPSVTPPSVQGLANTDYPDGSALPAAITAKLQRQVSNELASELGIVENMLSELRRNDVLRAFATVRPRDLAYALVDLPAALLNLANPYNISIPPMLLTPGSAALATYASDSRS